ncbi:MAG TPA: DUF4160 domain-containing protein [Candidatus Brocadiales bacterium]|nr:DUF4160 domain-containing protein [Candidatus Brocadiales bacterium]
MPIISRFFGIIIYMFWREHQPPHFHAKYGDEEVIVEIETGKVSGNISKRALNIVQEWRELHRDEILKDWELAEQNKPLRRIDPLE